MNPFAVAPDEVATNELKAKFAVALLKNPDQPFVAGIEVFGADTGKALFAAQHWINDDYVMQKQRELLKTKGARSFLPSKEDAAREVWRLATNERTPIEDKRHMLSLFCEIMGYKTQAEKAGVNVNVTQNRVMIVKDHGDAVAWERAAMAQQAALQEGAIDVPARILN